MILRHDERQRRKADMESIKAVVFNVANECVRQRVCDSDYDSMCDSVGSEKGISGWTRLLVSLSSFDRRSVELIIIR